MPRLHLALVSLVLAALVLVAAPAAVTAQGGTEPVRIQVTFEIYDEQGEHVSTAVTDETVAGRWSVGTWENTGVLSGSRTTGKLLAYHVDEGIIARVTQARPASGVASVLFLGGHGTVYYALDSGERGTVPFSAAPSGANVWRITLLGPAPPVLFNHP